MLQKLWAFIGCFLFVWFQAKSQEFQFDHFSVADGLSQAAIQAIAEDSVGFIWFGTRDGLNKFDGQQFTVFKKVPGDSTSLSNNTITSLAFDSDNRLWVGTIDGLNLYNPVNSTFTTFYIYENGVQRQSRIECLAPGSNGNIWVGTNAGLYLFKPNTNSFKKLNEINDKYIKSIVYENEHLWVATFSGLFRYNLQDSTIKIYGSESHIDLLVETLFKDLKNNLWVGTESGLYKYLPDNDSFEKFSSIKSMVYSISEYKKHLLISTGPLIDFDPATDIARTFDMRFGNKNKISRNNILRLFVDHAGIIWVGNNGEGIDYYDPNKNHFQLLRKTENGNGLPDDYVSAFEEDAEGRIWIGTAAGICNYNPSTFEFQYVLQNERITQHNRALLRDGKNLWLGGTLGLAQYNLVTGELKSWNAGKGKNQISSNVVVSLLKRKDGKIWIGTLDGVDIYNPGTNSFEKIIASKDEYGLSDPGINSIIEDQDGYVWISTHNGLNRMDPETRKIEKFYYDPNDTSTIGKSYVMSVFEDSGGNLWAATWGGGFSQIINKGERFKRFDSGDGLPDDVVYGFLEDENGYLWLSTNKGISRFNPVDNSFRNFTVEEGLQNNEFNTGAYFKAGNGTMYFGGISGVTSFDPSEIKINKAAPNTIIRDFVLFNQAKKDPETLKEELYHGAIRLNYNQNSFRAEFLSMNFTHSFKNQYKIRLFPFEKEWRDIGTVNFTIYTNIPPGNYQFQVSGSNNDLVWDPTPAKLILIISPPFYATFWFRALLVIFVAGIIVLIYRIRIRFYKQAKLRLEKEVKLRTSEVRSQKEELEQKSMLIERFNNQLIAQAKKLKEINNTLEEKVLIRTNQIQESHSQLASKNKALEKANEELDRFVYSVSHQLRAPLVSILGLINVAKLEKPGKSELDYLELIKKSINRLDESIREINDHARNIRLEILRKPIDFDSILTDIFSSMEYLEATGIVKVEKKIKETAIFRSDELRIKIILSNLISNALKYYDKHKPNPEIKIEISVDEMGSTMSVYDNGIGIPPEEQENIFKIFRRASEQGYGSGLGLYIVKEIVQKLNGSIEVDSKQGEYSILRVFIPHPSEDRKNIPSTESKVGI